MYVIIEWYTLRGGGRVGLYGIYLKNQVNNNKSADLPVSSLRIFLVPMGLFAISILLFYNLKQNEIFPIPDFSFLVQPFFYKNIQKSFYK